ncbi:MAG: tRNA (guanosine(46)-N7)-methyltransferase TrmB [Oscillospiraceae bacterium]|jgi:tRNA (guanine-N7-)-methyltransferase|nr:tRNA (guanosine(46)-N7)-methyltransferase TrmB [Oscillospiraceae bacterium]
MRKKKNLGVRLANVGGSVLRDTAEFRALLNAYSAGKLAAVSPGNAEASHQEAGVGICELEVGCGKGSFIVQAANAKPDTLFIAMEREENALVIAAERVIAEGIGNVRFIAEDAGKLTEFFRPGEVSCIYINFCDPWPGNRHVKRRLTAPGFLELYKSVLTDGGKIYFKTDNLDLFEFSRKSLERSGFTLTETESLPWNGWLTDYELKFLEQGREIYRLGAERAL